ncbi:MAG: hypothetical protein RLZ25_932 [Pseudomonadota bacterium]|jgi:ribulose-5-phosphate 4-epimerase/fuculose-1-phosphate aldolase
MAIPPYNPLVAGDREIEGVIKFKLNHQEAPLPQHPGFQELNAWRNLLFELGLTGQDPARYGGLGFGNMSIRTVESQFIISGSQTGGIRTLGVNHYVWVTRANPLENAIESIGPIQPSSESMTHASAYAACSWIQCVLHVHHPGIWIASESLGLPSTSPDVAYGTPAMAAEIERLARGTGGPVIAMKGHTDGLIAIGKNIQETGQALIDVLIKSAIRQTSSPMTREEAPHSLE